VSNPHSYDFVIMCTAATRTLRVFLVLFAAGVLVNAIGRDLVTLLLGLVLFAVIGWLGSLVLRRPAGLSAAIAILVAGLAAATTAWRPQAFAGESVLLLSPRQDEAFHYLMSTERFEMPHLGIIGVHSGGFLAMRILSRAPEADLGFKELVTRGTPAGQLYGLIGVRRTDPYFFRMNSWRCARRTDSLRVADGCVTSDKPIGPIVSDPEALHLPNGVSLSTWFRTHRDVKSIDISGGGFSSLFLDPEPGLLAEKDALLDESRYDFVRRRPWDPDR
jgi:hypothetical protein